VDNKDILLLISDHLKEIKEIQNEQAITLAKQSVILDEHVRRSTQLEARVEPLEKFQYKMSGALGLLSLCAILATILEIILKLKH
jgi:hypothetical protein